MAWERHIPSTPEQPAPPASGRWLLGFMLVIIVSIILFLLHAANHLGGLQVVNIWLVAVIPLVGYLLSFSLRSYLFGQALSQYHFLQDEAQTAQREWHQWAERYMAVLASCVLLPDKLTASLLLKQAANLPVQFGLTRRIDYLTKGETPVRQAITTLLGIIAEPLGMLPRTMPLHVTLVTDSDTGQDTMCALFSEGWISARPELPVPLDISVQSALPFDLIDRRTREAHETVDLILVLQLSGKERYSDGVGVFLLTPDDAAKKYALPVTGRLLRPMLLDPQHLASEINLFFDTQPLSLKAVGLLGDSRELLDLTYQIVPACNNKGGELTIDNVLTLERAMGLTGPLSAWLNAGLAVDFCRCQEEPYLMFSQCAPYWFVSTVSPGVLNENL
jgi:hypothetical protein